MVNRIKTPERSVVPAQQRTPPRKPLAPLDSNPIQNSSEAKKSILVPTAPKIIQLTKNQYPDLESIPTVGDKITHATPLAKAFIDKSGIFHIMFDENSGAKYLTYSKNSEHIDGAISATPKNGLFEIEYGKHPKSEQSGLGKKLIHWLEEHANEMNLNPAQFYAEVSSQSTKDINMPSYLTLLGAEFVPIKRPSGDGIRFVHPDSDAITQENYLSPIQNAYNRYSAASIANKETELESLKNAILASAPTS